MGGGGGGVQLTGELGDNMIVSLFQYVNDILTYNVYFNEPQG